MFDTVNAYSNATVDTWKWLGWEYDKDDIDRVHDLYDNIWSLDASDLIEMMSTELEPHGKGFDQHYYHRRVNSPKSFFKHLVRMIRYEYLYGKHDGVHEFGDISDLEMPYSALVEYCRQRGLPMFY